jgi:hypothetical protein
MRLALLVGLSLLLGMSAAEAQRPPGENIDASKMPESGPAVVGGTGATTGPNSKNQAVDPMPGLRERELSERPPDTVPSPPPRLPITPRR